MIDEKPIKNKEISHVVWPAPLEGPSGGYPVQPAAAAPESKKNPGHPVSWAGVFLKQLAKFPVAEHDDYVDTFTQAVIYLKNDGWFELPKAKDPDEPRQTRREYSNPYAA